MPPIFRRIITRIEVSDLGYEAAVMYGNFSVTLFTPERLKRSTHPVICLSVTEGADKLLYLGSSFGDGARDYAALAADADYVVFGQHSPVTKKAFSLKTDGFMLFGGKEIAAFAAVLPGNSSYTFDFDRN